MEVLHTLLHVGLIVGGLLLILLILLRKGESGGLSGAFGGVGGETVFGVKAQKQLDKVITFISAIFILIAVLLNTPLLRSQSTAELTPDELKQEQEQEQPTAPTENTPN